MFFKRAIVNMTVSPCLHKEDAVCEHCSPVTGYTECCFSLVACACCGYGQQRALLLCICVFFLFPCVFINLFNRFALHL